MEKDKDLLPEENEGDKAHMLEGDNTLVETDGADSVETTVKNNKKGKKNKETEPEDSSEEIEKPKKKFYAETWFLVTLASVAFVAILAVLIMTALGGGLSFKNLFGKGNGDLDYVNDSLDKYIDIKESDYKGIKINVPLRKPGEKELETRINELLATHRGNPVVAGGSTAYDNYPIAIGDDINVSYLGYQLDADGRKLLISGASNVESANTKTDRLTVGVNAGLYGVGFDSALVGKTPNGKIDSVRGEGVVLSRDEIIYATVSFVLDNGLVYDEVDVCIDPSAENFESLWGIDAYEDLFENQRVLGYIITGDSFYTLPLSGGGQITYTALEIKYISKSSVKPMTVESYIPADYSVEELQNKTVYYDLYVNNVIKYNVSEFNDEFVTEKLGLTAEKLAAYEGETLAEKCKSYHMASLNTEFESTCRTYLENAIWQKLFSTVKIKTYPEKEIDRIYLAEVEAYTADLIEENANGAGYENLDDYMPGALGLEEGAEWTSYLLELVKRTVKERLIVYAILRQEGILPVGEEFDALYEKELMNDYEHAISIYPGSFASLEEYRAYVYETRGELDYVHDVYYYYLTDKLIEYVTPVYSES